SSSFCPLNSVEVAMRWSSWLNCWTSAFNAERSPLELVALAACTESSRIRCSRSPEDCRAPSAVWDSEMPSLALRRAWSRPRIWEVKRSEIARPAASSLALLIRKPEDRRCREVAREDWEVLRLRWAFSEATLVLMVSAMTISLMSIYGTGRLQLDFLPTNSAVDS